MVEQKRFWEWFQIVVIGGMFALAAARWGSIPDQVPIHWRRSKRSEAPAPRHGRAVVVRGVRR